MFTEYDANGWLFVVATVIVVQNPQIGAQLCQIANLEPAILQLEHHGAVQVAIKEQEAK